MACYTQFPRFDSWEQLSLISEEGFFFPVAALTSLYYQDTCKPVKYAALVVILWWWCFVFQNNMTAIP